MKESVIEFIERRWHNSNANWLNGNCYWFAKILCDRFPYLRIYYLPIEGHFIAADPISKKYYDWTGEIELKEQAISLEYIKKNDIVWYNRLWRDCIS